MNALSVDMSGRSNLAIDARIHRFMANQIQRAPHYVLPRGGMVSRVQDQALTMDLNDAKCPYTSFTIEFQISETGMAMETTPEHIVPSYVRFALVQDLRDPVLARCWMEIFNSYLLHVSPHLCDHALMVIPVSRVGLQGQPLGPGHRGWTLSWLASLVDTRQPPFVSGENTVANGLYERTSVYFQPVPLGITGVMAQQQLNTDQATLDRETHREIGLEMLAAMDLMISLGKGTFRPRQLTGQDRCFSVGNPPFDAPILLNPVST